MTETCVHGPRFLDAYLQLGSMRAVSLLTTMKYLRMAMNLVLATGFAALATANPIDDRPIFTFLITAMIYEPCVVLVEAVAYVALLRISVFRALLISVLANAASLVIGFVVGLGLGGSTFTGFLLRHLALAWILEVPILILLTLDQPGKNPLPHFTRRAVWTGVGTNAATNAIGLLLLAALR